MISVVCPSRGRPELAKRMVDSLLKDPGCEIEILIYLNLDDPKLEEYKKILDPKHYQVGVDRSPVYSWNQLALQARYDIIFLMGDDAQVNTPKWGKYILSIFDQYPDKIAMVSPKAENLGKSKCPHFFLHKNWIRTVGYFVPPFFHHHYIDHWVRDVATQLRRYIHLTEFVMPIVNNVGDDTINRYTGSWLKDRDQELWDISDRFKTADAQVLKKFIDNFKG